MSRKQLLLLFICNLVPGTIANGLTPVLPIYALQLGVSKAASGYYLAFAFFFVAVGMILAGWLADILQRRKLLLIISSGILIPSIWLIGRATNIWQLAGATAAVWFSGGMLVSVIIILAGLSASKERRGRVLGFIGMTAGFGSIIGGLSIGPIVDRWGYPTMFTALCLFSLILLVCVFFVKDKKLEQETNKTTQTLNRKSSFGKTFFLLLLAHLVVMTTSSVANLGRSLSMNSLGFAATAVTSTVVVSGLVSLPFPFMLGWLSDRKGRKRMIEISYTSMGLCMVMLAISSSLWHFWIAIILLKLGLVSMNVGQAFVADLIEPKALGRGASTFFATQFIAQTIGYIVGGKAHQDFGIAPTSFVSTALPVIGIILIMLIRVRKKEQVCTE